MTPETPVERRLREMAECPHCTNGLRPSTHVDEEQPMALCGYCDGGPDPDDKAAIDAGREAIALLRRIGSNENAADVIAWEHARRALLARCQDGA